MKNKTTTLFLLTTIFIFFLGILKSNETVDFQFHDFYFVVSYFDLAILIGFFTALTTLIYFIFDIFKRPIKSKIGFWHFGLFTTSLIIILATNFLAIKYNYFESNYPFQFSYKILVMTFLLGIILFLCSYIVFLYGLIECLFLRKGQK
jgi:heme/copper-type cytochrome/quinol oxidase subunit 1